MSSKAMASLHRQQAGVSLIEVLISVVILGIGMLGIAAMQAKALQNNSSSLERSQMVVQSYAILDAMRANLTAARAGAYNIAMTCPIPAGGTLAANDQRDWITALKASMGSSACGSIQCEANGITCTVTVRWDDSRATALGTSDTAGARQFSVVTRL
ncbi:type IV pilus modification protein PilV [Xanthomonas hydrangeae]|uniref:type IV pilus modification protein PilV n=1 Tax=Xanthomonas hydrangeae TaxID=2775159 RepID=UPI001962CC21